MKFKIHGRSSRGKQRAPFHRGKEPSTVRDEYAGCQVADPDFELQEVKVEDLKAEDFWERYISQRRPVLIKGHPLESDWRASALWTNDYLIKHVGSSELMIEERNNNHDRFGKGNKVKMTFEKFLREVEGGSTKLYLSTQPCGKDADGFPKLFVPPASGLQQDFPLVPELIGHLVPQQINMWMGAATDGSTSGLHHDFHDNLYILLRGAKRFRLYDPSLASRMYTCGRLQQTHPNGRIVYRGQGDVTADGVEQREVTRWEKMRAAEELLEAARAADEANRGDDKLEAAQQLASAEQQLEDLLDDALEDADLDFDDFEEEDSKQHDGGDRQRDAEDPPSFSRIDLRADDKVLKRQWPDFPGKAAAATVTMEAGDMLYLPAGWFHEVTSFGSPKLGGHLALNYWFYPPSNLDPSGQGFKKPYTSEYLPTMWQQRQRQFTTADTPTEQDGVTAVRSSQSETNSSSQHAQQATTGGKETPGKKKQKKKRKAADADIEEEHDDDDAGGHETDGGRPDWRELLTQVLQERPTAASTQLLQALFGARKKKKRPKPVWWWRGRRHHVAVFVPRDPPHAPDSDAEAHDNYASVP